jgi:Arc/MetJ-type ribon-helix-helix transcriptional regulator
MTLSLPPELEKRVESEIAFGGFQNSNQLIEEAIIRFLDSRRAQRRRESLDRLTDAVIEAGLYDKVYIPSDKDE